jgi:hypothetical protein
MTVFIETGATSREPVTMAPSPTTDQDVARGRRRDRSMTRVTNNSVRADESSTLRGRSRRRATSPPAGPSRGSTPSLMSPTRQLLLHNRLRETRRQHCPSRKQSPTGQPALQRRRRQRSRSRSRGLHLDLELHRGVDHSSGLRHEVLVDEGSTAHTADDIDIAAT